MKIEVERDTLSGLLRITSGIAREVSGMAATACVLIEVKPGILTVGATNLDVTVKVDAQIHDAAAGRVAVPARKLYDLVRSFAAAPVTMEADGQRLHVRCQRASAVIAGIDPDHLPLTWQSAEEPSSRLIAPSSALRRGIDRTLYCTDEDDSRPWATGIHWSADHAGLRLSATDGHRLAVYHVPGVDVSGVASAIIPRAACELLRSVTDGLGEMPINVEITPTAILVTFERITVRAMLIAASFPEIDQVIPARPRPTTAMLDRAALIAAIRRAAMVDARAVAVVVEADDVIVRAEANDGSAMEPVEAVVIGAAGGIRINPRYLLDALEVMAGAEVEIGWDKSGLGPVLLIDPTDAGALAVVMPVN